MKDIGCSRNKMAEEQNKRQEEGKQRHSEARKGKPEEMKKGRPEPIVDETESLIRILATDIPGSKRVIAGLTRIKGVSWTFSNAVLNKLGLDKTKKIEQLSKDEIVKISEFIMKPNLPAFLLNRKKDFDTGENKHLIGSDLDLQKEFDIKRMKKIRCYKGIRHIMGQPVRGQRTRSHFRKNKTVGVTKSSIKK
jgi:small subunit ribosomal protein S13